MVRTGKVTRVDLLLLLLHSMRGMVTPVRVASLQVGITVLSVLRGVVGGVRGILAVSSNAGRRVSMAVLRGVVSVALVVLVRLGMGKRIVVVHLVIVRRAVSGIVHSGPGGEVVVRDTRNIVGVRLELLDKLLSLSVRHVVRRGPMERFLQAGELVPKRIAGVTGEIKPGNSGRGQVQGAKNSQIIVHTIIARAKVDRLHPRVKPV